jgi:hypothetical protein
MSLFEESLALYRELGREGEGTAQCLINLAFLLFRSGADAEALATARESLALSHRIGDVRSTIYNLVLLSSLAARQNDHSTSARLLGAAEAERVRVGLAFENLEAGLYEKTLVELRASLEDKRFQAAVAEGGSLALEQAVARALAETQ